MATPITNVKTAQVLAGSVGPHEPFTPTASFDQNRDSEQDNEKGGELSPLDVVGFDGPGDAYDPVYWPKSKKWGVLLVVALMTMITPLSPSMFASALPEVLMDYPPDKTILSTMVVSVYALGLAFGPLVIAPLSELYGRLVLYHVTAILFVVFSIACAVSNNLNMLIGFQFLQGCAGAAPITMGGGTVADMFSQTERGSRIAVLAIGPLLTLLFGPVAGSFLAAARGWRWVFWLMAILAGGTEILYCCFLRETYPSVVLEKKAQSLRNETGNQNLRSKLHKNRSPRTLLLESLVRPFKMLFLYPVVFGLAVHVAIGYSYFYLLLTTLAEVFIGEYAFKADIIGLVFLGIGVGMAVGTISFGILSDKRLKYKARMGEMKPEYRLEPMIAGGISIPIGLFIYGWTTQYGVHWFVPILGTAFVGMGLMWLLLPIDTYLVDAYPMYAASSIGATTVFRSVVGAFLPLAGPPMYARLDLGWGNSVLAFIAIALIPIPLLFLKYGEAIRKNPRFQWEL